MAAFGKELFVLCFDFLKPGGARLVVVLGGFAELFEVVWIDAAVRFVVGSFEPQVFFQVGVAYAEEALASAFDAKPEFLQGLDRVFPGPDASLGDVVGRALGDVFVDRGNERLPVFRLLEVIGG